jgi:hypothetical protein
VNRSLTVSATALLLLGLPAAAGADTRYAEPGGDGPEPCLRGNPCDVEVAVESLLVENGDEVVLLSGDYVLADELVVIDDIVLHGEDGQPRPRIVSTGARAVATNFTSEALIRDLEIEHDGPGPALDVAVDVLRVEVHTTGSFACSPFFPMTIRDSICHSSGSPISTGLRLGGGGAATYDFRAVNVTAVGDDYGVGMSTGGGFNASLTGSNVIAQGGTFDVRAEAEDAMAGTDADITLDHSNFQTTEVIGAQASAPAAGSGDNQIALPVFVNAAGGDFHQAPSSPTIDAGAAVTDLGPLDVDRDPRVLDVAPDIGADELDPNPPQTRIVRGPRKRVRTRRARAKARFVLAADEPGVTFECKLDRKPYRPCASPFRRKVRARPGKGARHVLRVRATDPSGNVDPSPAVRRWRAVRLLG